MARNQSVEQFRARIAAIPARARAEAALALHEQAQRLIAQQKRLVPKGDTFALANSIRSTVLPLGTKVLIEAGGQTTTKPVREGASATYDYALAAEFGRQGQTASPFFYPAYRLLKKSMKQAIGKAVTRGVKAAFEGE